MAGPPRTRGAAERLVDRAVLWFDARIGLSHQFLRPAPTYSVNPFYWLGALAVVAFVIQGITGMLMMIYYIPTPTQAYSSTLYIFQDVSYGRFLETVHLYTAYAMIMLAFMHMMRGFFVSVQKKPRELMWLTGMGMGFVTLGFGFTGYLLPWSVVSKSATDVGIGMIGALPPQFSSYITFLVVGGGSYTEIMLRFFELHVVVLPAVLLLLLAGKMYMLETHGVSEPVLGPVPLPEKRRKLIPIFPDLSLYLLELAALFGVAMLLISVAFPLTLPPQYTPALASQYTPQPDWYFLWIYQILKISLFEGAGLPVALSVVTLIFVALTLLPFMDRGETRRIESRRIVRYSRPHLRVRDCGPDGLGVPDPGENHPHGAGRARPRGHRPSDRLGLGRSLQGDLQGSACGDGPFEGPIAVLSPGPSTGRERSTRALLWTAASFVAVLTLGAFGIGGSIAASVQLIVQGANLSILSLWFYLSENSRWPFVGTLYLLYRLDLGTGSIKRRVKAFEVGWKP